MKMNCSKPKKKFFPSMKSFLGRFRRRTPCWAAVRAPMFSTHCDASVPTSRMRGLSTVGLEPCLSGYLQHIMNWRICRKQYTNTRPVFALTRQDSSISSRDLPSFRSSNASTALNSPMCSTGMRRLVRRSRRLPMQTKTSLSSSRR